MRRLNKLLALALALLLAFTLAACGDSFESAMVRALREMQDVESVHADMALDMSFGVDVLGESTSMDIAMDMAMDTAGDLTSGELTMTMLGFPITVTYIVEKNGDAYFKFREVKALICELAQTENSIYRLAYAIKKAQKRANALKNIVIPGLEDEIFRISDALEEKEREEFVRLKVVKSRNERLKGEQNAQTE